MNPALAVQEVSTLFNQSEIKFDRDNPEVWYEFERLALDLMERTNHYGAKAIFEVMRFHRALETDDTQFKLNNNYTSYYARKFNLKYNTDFFETRQSNI